LDGDNLAQFLAEAGLHCNHIGATDQWRVDTTEDYTHQRPNLLQVDKAVAPAREMRASGLAVSLVVHDHKRLDRRIELTTLAEQRHAVGIGLQFLTGELQDSHDPAGAVFTVLAALSGLEHEYIRDRALEGHEVAHACDKSIGAAAVTDEAMLFHVLHLRDQQSLSLRDIDARLVITAGKKKGQNPSPAIVLRIPPDHHHDRANAEDARATSELA
jgi:hypothetical protein